MTWSKSGLGNVVFENNQIVMKPNEVYFKNNPTGIVSGDTVGGGYYFGQSFVVHSDNYCTWVNLDLYLSGLTTTTGWDGWRIPNITELGIMYNNKILLNMTSHGYVSSTAGPPISWLCICFFNPTPPPTPGQIVNGYASVANDYCYRAIRDL